MGIEFLLGILKKFWNWITQWLYNNVNAPNVMELYTLNDLNGKFYGMYILPPPSKKDPPKNSSERGFYDLPYWTLPSERVI